MSLAELAQALKAIKQPLPARRQYNNTLPKETDDPYGDAAKTAEAWTELDDHMNQYDESFKPLPDGQNGVQDTPMNRLKEQLDAMMKGGNPTLQKQALSMMNNYQKNRTDKDTVVDASGDMTLEEYMNAPPDKQAMRDRYKNYQPPAAIQKRNLLAGSKTAEEYMANARNLGMDKWVDVTDGFINATTAHLPEAEKRKIVKNIADAKAQERIGDEEGKFVAGFGRDMALADNAYGDIEYTMEGLNELAGLTDYSTTGMASFLKYIPGTDAGRWRELKESTLSRLALDKIIELKRSSPTGATGLGALSDNELVVLQKYLGSLEQAQTPDEIKRSVRGIYGQLARFQKAIKTDQKRKARRYDVLAEEQNVSARYDTSRFKDQKPYRDRPLPDRRSDATSEVPALEKTTPANSIEGMKQFIPKPILEYGEEYFGDDEEVAPNGLQWK